MGDLIRKGKRASLSGVIKFEACPNHVLQSVMLHKVIMLYIIILYMYTHGHACYICLNLGQPWLYNRLNANQFKSRGSPEYYKRVIYNDFSMSRACSSLTF